MNEREKPTGLPMPEYETGVSHPCCFLDTPVGPVRVSENARGIASLRFAAPEDRREDAAGKGLYLADAAAQLREYFAGRRRVFDVPLSPWGSDFQRRVWEALRDIPCGQTRTYQQLAALLGNPKAARAVGAANHRNPILILIPCHRVMGKDGRLAGYAGGLERKRFLLDLEAGRYH